MNAEIKICGLMSADDILKVNDFDIGYVGFVFAESRRKVSKECALKMKQLLRKDIKTVGVFADMDISVIKEISDFVDLDIVQLHSDESDEMCASVGRTVWKSISVRDENSVKAVYEYKNAYGFLLDTYRKNMRGGTGEAFTWDFVKGFSDRYFTILAGGIGEHNIMEAYDAVRPNVIDLSSSVETDGVKDYDKIKRLMRRIQK